MPILPVDFLDAPPPRPAPSANGGSWRALLLSDTHGRLPAKVAALIPEVDAVLHCGDIDEAGTWAEINALAADAAPVVAVCGNCDQSPLWESLPERAVVETPFGAIALMHSHTLAARPDRRHEALVAACADVPNLALIAYGHSHRPVAERWGHADDPAAPLILNPGSASQPRGLPWGSVVVLDFAAPPAGDVEVEPNASKGLSWTFVRVPSIGPIARPRR